MSAEPHKGLIPGEVYKIRLDDCCIEGELRGRFLGWDFGDDNEEQEYDRADALFDIGRIGPGWGAWACSPAEEA